MGVLSLYIDSGEGVLSVYIDSDEGVLSVYKWNILAEHIVTVL